MIKGWISSVASKLSKAIGGAQDADTENQGDGNMASEVEHMEEGEIAEEDIDSQRGPAEEDIDSQRGPAEEDIDSQRGPGEEDIDSQRGPAEDDINNKRGPAEEDIDSQRGPAEEDIDNQRSPAEEDIDNQRGPAEEDIDSQRGPAEEDIDNQRGPAEEALDSRNVQPVPQNSEDVHLEEVKYPVEDQCTGSSIIVKEKKKEKKKDKKKDKKPKGMDDSFMPLFSYPRKPVTYVQSPIRATPFESCGKYEDEEVTDSLGNKVIRKKLAKKSTTREQALAKLRSLIPDHRWKELTNTEKSDNKVAGIVVSEEIEQQSEQVLSEVKNKTETEVQEASMIISEEDTFLNSADVTLKESQAGGDDGKKEISCEQERYGIKVSEIEEEENNEEGAASHPSVTTTDADVVPIGEGRNYLEFVLQKTAEGEVVPAKYLIYRLGMLKLDPKIVESAILDQYNIAVKKKFAVWIEHCRYHAELLYSPTWIAENMPKLNMTEKEKEMEKRKLERRSKRKAKQWAKETNEMCRDIRLRNEHRPILSLSRFDPETRKVVVYKHVYVDEYEETEEAEETSNFPSAESGEGSEVVKDQVGDNVTIGELGKKVNVEKSKGKTQECDIAEEEESEKQNNGEKYSDQEPIVPLIISERLPEIGDGDRSETEPEKGESEKSSLTDDDNGKHRKKLSPCQKGKSVETSEIDISAVETEDMEKIEEIGSHSGRERRKSDVYDKRKDRVDDNVSRESKKPKTKEEAMEKDNESEESKRECKEVPNEDKHLSIDQETSSSSQILTQEVDICGTEINRASTDALTPEALKTDSSNEEHPSGLTELPHLTELSKDSSIIVEDKNTMPVHAHASLPKLGGVKEASDVETENQDLLQPSTEDVMFENNPENRISSLSHLSETDAGSETSILKNDKKEMPTSASHSSLLESNVAVSSGDRKEDPKILEKSGQDNKTHSTYLNTDVCNLTSNLLVSPDCVVSPKFEVPPNTPSDFVEIPQSAKLMNLNAMQNKVKLEKEVADLLSGMTLKLRHPVGSDLEEFHAEESKADASDSPVKKESGDESKDLPIQSADSAIISADNSPINDMSVKELERMDTCLKHDLDVAEEGRCSPEEYLCMLQQVLPNVTSITKLKSGQQEEKDGIQCDAVSSSTNRESSSIVSDGACADVHQSPTEIVSVCDLSVAENVEIPCKMHTEEEKSALNTTETMKEHSAEHDSLFTSKDDLPLNNEAINRPEDSSQSGGVRLVKSMHEEKKSDELRSDSKISDDLKKCNNSGKSSISKSSESNGQITKQRLSRTLSKSEEKLKQAVKPPWNSNTKVDHGKSGNITPSRIPKASKTNSTSQMNTKQTDEISKSSGEKNECLSLEGNLEVVNVCRDEHVFSSDNAEIKNVEKEKPSHLAEDKTKVTPEDKTSKDKTTEDKTTDTSEDKTTVTSEDKTSEDKTTVTSEDKTSEDKTTVTTEDKTTEDKTTDTTEDKTTVTSEDNTTVTSEDKTSEDKTTVTSEDKTTDTSEDKTTEDKTTVTSEDKTTEDKTTVTSEDKTTVTSEDKTTVTSEDKTTEDKTTVTSEDKTTEDKTTVTSEDKTTVTSEDKTSEDKTTVTTEDKTSEDKTTVASEDKTSEDKTTVTSEDKTTVTSEDKTTEDKTTDTTEDKTTVTSEDKTTVTSEDKTTVTTEDKTTVTSEDKTTEDKTTVTSEDKTTDAAEDETSVTSEDKTTEDKTTVTSEDKTTVTSEDKTSEDNTTVTSEDKTTVTSEDKTTDAAEDETTDTPEDISIIDSSNSSEKGKNVDQVQGVLSEIEKESCEMDQVEGACKTEMSSQSTQEHDESLDSTASASPNQKSPSKWKGKNPKKGKGRQKKRW